MTDINRRAFFATLFAPLLVKLLPAPKAGERVFSDELLNFAMATPLEHPAAGEAIFWLNLRDPEIQRFCAEMDRFHNNLRDLVFQMPPLPDVRPSRHSAMIIDVQNPRSSCRLEGSF